MTTPLLIEGGIYQPDGSAIARVGQTAVLDLQIQTPGEESGPFEPAPLEDRFFVQRLIGRDGAVVTEIEATRPDDWTVRFTLAVTQDLVTPAKAIDLTHKIVELLDGDVEDEVLSRPFSIRARSAGAPSATLTIGDAGRLVVRYAGAPGLSAAAQLKAAGLLEAPTGDALAAWFAELALTAAETVTGVLILPREIEGPTAAVLATDLNRVLVADSGTDVPLTIPNTLVAGFFCVWMQKGPGLIGFEFADGVSAVVPEGRLPFSSGIGAVGTIVVLSNESGTAPVVAIAGSLG